MNERYSRIYTINNAFYTPNCPIIISSGALSKDNKLGNFIAQFKFLNASTKTIKEVVVEISYYDASKNLLEVAVPFTYSNLEASPGELFGHKTPITILNPATRIISTKIKNIVFLSGEKLIIEEQELKPVPQKQELPDFLGKELAIQYAKDVYKDSKYVPMVFDDFWSCTCGSINQIGDSCCNSCRTKKDKQFLGLDHTLLHENKKKYDENEKKKKNDFIYNKACEEMTRGNISDVQTAIEKFKSIIEWKDSKTKIDECNKIIKAIEEKEKQRQIEEEKSRVKKKKITLISIIALIIGLCIGNSIYQDNLKNSLVGQTFIISEEFERWDFFDVYSGYRVTFNNNEKAMKETYHYYDRMTFPNENDPTKDNPDIFTIGECNYEISGWYSNVTITIDGKEYKLRQLKKW